MKLCVITVIISYSLLSGCNSAKIVKNTKPNEISASTPVQIQKMAPQNSILVEPTESKKERALRELLSEAATHQQTHTLSTNDPEDLFILYIDKITNNWVAPKDITPKTDLILEVQMSADGTVSSIQVAQTSGEYQYDNSAILALRGIGIFNEVKDLSELDYKKYFKLHQIKFGPLIQNKNQ